MAAEAPAAARSGFPLADRAVIRGSPLDEDVTLPGPALVRRFRLAAVAPVAPETRLDAAFIGTEPLLGLGTVRSMPRPLGGSGKGLDMVMVLFRLTGDDSLVGMRGTGAIF